MKLKPSHDELQQLAIACLESAQEACGWETVMLACHLAAKYSSEDAPIILPDWLNLLVYSGMIQDPPSVGGRRGKKGGDSADARTLFRDVVAAMLFEALTGGTGEVQRGDKLIDKLTDHLGFDDHKSTRTCIARGSAYLQSTPANAIRPVISKVLKSEKFTQEIRDIQAKQA